MNDHTHIKELISAEYDGQATSKDQGLIAEHLKDCTSCQDYSAQLHKLSATLQEWTNENPSPDLERKIHKGLKEAAMNREKIKSKKKPTFKIGMGAGSLIVAIIALAVSLQTYAQRSLQSRVRDAGQYLAAPISQKGQYDIGMQFSPGNQNAIATTRVTSSSTDTFVGGVTSSTLIGSLRTTDKMNSSVINAEQGFWDGAGRQQIARGYSAQYEPYYLETNYTVFRSESDAQKLASLQPMVIAAGARILHEPKRSRLAGGNQTSTYGMSFEPAAFVVPYREQRGNTEQYDRIYENEFLTVKENPLSTFSIDVDTASYSNMRRFLNQGQLPPQDAVRIEELINYFTYDYPKPQGEHPFSVTTKASVCPWNKKHNLVQIGIQGKTLAEDELPPSNLVFLIDVSGSMAQANKLPLLKTAFKMLVNQLGGNERIAIVVYAGAAGMVLDSTPGSNKQAIRAAIDNLQSGGSTAGGAGIKLAYKIARDNFIKEGNNRVILATDGDFNVGASSNAEMIRLIEEERKSGTFLTVLGFGTGNYKDSRMEQIADKGNGNYYYIDTQREAKKVLVNELGSTLFTIAKDVKLQIEFNPTQIKAYRLIGYENRILAKEDFNDDTKDAGELGAGHTVTALYEIVPADSIEAFGNVDELSYQQTKTVQSNDLMTVKLRYKAPDGHKSKLIKKVIERTEMTVEPTGDFEFASAVAEFGLLLRKSQYKEGASYQHVLEHARNARGKDAFGYRSEFISLVEKAQILDIEEPDSPGIMFKSP